MDPHLTEIWDEAQRLYLNSLSETQRQTVKSIQCQERLLANLADLKKKYDQRRMSRLMDRIYPLITHLGSFSEVIKAFVQINSSIASPIWGSIYLIIDVNQHRFHFVLCDQSFSDFKISWRRDMQLSSGILLTPSSRLTDAFRDFLYISIAMAAGL
jgi:hypothetical protein